jgi:putative hemolysin
LYEKLADYLVEPGLRTVPMTAYAASLEVSLNDPPKAPKLLRAYLTVGAKICGPPALDREFGTIDFLTMLDLEGISPVVRARFLGE